MPSKEYLTYTHKSSALLRLSISKWLAFPVYRSFIDDLIWYLESRLGLGDFYFEVLEGQLHNRKYDKERIKLAKLRLLVQFTNTLLFHEKNKVHHKHINTVSASDIASYSFCPVSYAIKKSYNLASSPIMTRGSEFHEQTRLINRYLKEYPSESKHSFNDDVSQFFSKLSSSQLIYSGHLKEHEKRYFKNGDFICQPDYIFVDKEGDFFIVEEKFRFHSWTNYWENDYKFFKNHKLQVASYIYGINEIDIPKISYGFLLYWEYSIDFENNHKFLDANLLKINRSEYLLEEIRGVAQNVRSINATLQSRDEVAIDLNVNYSKCSACSVHLLCGHKIYNQSVVKLPYYEGNYYPFADVNLPVSLAKYKTALDDFFGDRQPCHICLKWFDSKDIELRYIRPIQFVEPIGLRNNQEYRNELDEVIYLRGLQFSTLIKPPEDVKIIDYNIVFTHRPLLSTPSFWLIDSPFSDNCLNFALKISHMCNHCFNKGKVILNTLTDNQ